MADFSEYLHRETNKPLLLKPGLRGNNEISAPGRKLALDFWPLLRECFLWGV